MLATRRRKIVAGFVLLLLLAIFVPPNINGTVFRRRLAGALSTALGREVRIGQVKYRILPRPGFDIYDLRVMDDPAFSAEPVIMCGKVTADLRLTSLWRGRMEIAKLKLTDDAAPPSLNLVYSKGHWNLESLLVRVEQVPSAPTAKRSAEERPRFPYIEATDGRINLKIGPEKKPHTITNTDFAFWLASEDQWHVRVKGRPLRTDMNLNGTGTIRLEGDLHRSADLRAMPVKLELAWQEAQLGQFSSLVAGRDPGWRGVVSGDVQLTGTPENLHIVGAADLREFRRYDINRNSMPRIRARCLGEYARDSLNLKCETPLDPGGVVLTARWSSAMPDDYDLSAVATRVPLSLLTTFARHARQNLPDRLAASGDLNGAFGFHSHNGVRNWHGTGMTSAFLLQASDSEKPFPVSGIRFHVGPPETAATFLAHKTKKQAATAPGNALNIDSFSIQLGPSTTLQVQATADGKGYWLGAKGMVPLERLLALGNATGFQNQVSNTTASAVVDLNITGDWQSFAPAKLRGTAHLQNAAAWIPGIKDRLLISEADVQLSEIELVLTHLQAQFEHTPVAFSGTVDYPFVCQGVPPCPLEFQLHSDSMALADAASLFIADKGWNLPFLSDNSNKLPKFRAGGIFTAGELRAARLPLENFKAKVEVGDNALLVSSISARVAGGSADGDWRADWSSGVPRFSASGSFTNIAMEKINPAEPELQLLAGWISGHTDAKYSVKFEGSTAESMRNSLAGGIEYLVTNGSSRAILVDGARPLKFQSFQGAVQLDRQGLKVLPSKFRAENRIYELSGTVSLAEKQARLRLSNSGSRWEITGTLENPVIVSQQARAETAAARTR